MAEYIPLFKPGQAQTRAASAPIVGGQIVAVSGSGTVAPAGVSALGWIGVAGFDAATGADVTVFTGGVQRPLASGTVTAGDLVVCGASGTVATLSAVSTPTAADVTGARALVGVALSTATTGLPVEVQFLR